MDLRGRELNHFKAAFFSMIRKVVHLIGSKAPARVILDLKESKSSWGPMLPS